MSVYRRPHWAAARMRIKQELGTIVRLAFPLILARLAASSGNFIDVVLAGHVGRDVLAQVAVGANVWWLVIVTSTGIMMSVPPTIAQLDGAGRRNDIGVVFRQACWLALALGVLLAVSVRHAGLLVGLLGVPNKLRNEVEVQHFLNAISWGAPALTGFAALRGLSEGLSLPRVSVYFSAGGLLLSLPLGYLLMFGKLGIAPQGARGCGLATAIVLWVELIAFLAYVLHRPEYAGLGLLGRFDLPQAQYLVPLVKIGLPIAVGLWAEVGLLVASALSIGVLGDTVSAAYQIALNAISILFMIPLGIAMAITVRVGKAVGYGDISGLQCTVFCGIGLSLMAQIFSALVMLIFPRFIAKLYTADIHVLAIASQLLILASLFQLSDGLQVSVQGALRGMKDTRGAMVITLFAYWGVGMPLGSWLAFRHELGARGMFMGLIAGLSTAAIMLFLRLWRILPSSVIRTVAQSTAASLEGSVTIKRSVILKTPNEDPIHEAKPDSCDGESV